MAPTHCDYTKTVPELQEQLLEQDADTSASGLCRVQETNQPERGSIVQGMSQGPALTESLTYPRRTPCRTAIARSTKSHPCAKIGNAQNVWRMTREITIEAQQLSSTGKTSKVMNMVHISYTSCPHCKEWTLTTERRCCHCARPLRRS